MTEASKEQHDQEYEALLSEYATGSLDEARALIIATHATLNPSIRDRLYFYESVGGHLLEKACQPVELSKGSLENMLQHLEDLPGADETRQSSNPVLWDIQLPRPLARYSPGESALGKIKSFMSGMETLNLPVTSDYSAHLIRMKPGITVPEHGHGGEEMTLILDGAMHDQTGTYGRGDLILLDERESHSPRADDQKGCICLAVTSAPVKLKGLMGSLINPFLSK